MDWYEILDLDGTVHLTSVHGEHSYDAGAPTSTLCGTQVRRPPPERARSIVRRIREGRTCLRCQACVEPEDQLVTALSSTTLSVSRR